MPVVFSLITLGAACASSGAPGATASECGLQPRDSVYAANAPVYRACGVSTQVLALNSGFHPDFTPPSRSAGCYSAEWEFVVTRTGVVDTASARLLKSNNPELAEATRALLPRMRFEPAKRDGIPVAQITTYKSALQSVVVVSSTATAGARPRPGRSGPGC